MMNSMKQLLRLTIQAVLSAERPASADTARGVDALPSISRVDAPAQRGLKTRLGTITLRLLLINDVPFASRLFVRYAAVETSFLLLLGRILVRGRATPETVRHIAENLCGHPFPAERIAEIAKAIEDELTRYLEQELEHARGRTLAGFAH
jgi:hypothetical protein